jgi:cytoskeleton protein RodZ
MSDSGFSHSGASIPVAPAANDGPTAGMLLRRAREAAGLHVAALAVSLKVPVRKLEALEADQYNALGDLVFVRALASSICRSLKVDPQPVLDLLPQNTTPRLIEQRPSLNTPFRAPSDGTPPSWYEQVNRPVFLSVFALLLGALVLILLPTVQQDQAAEMATKPEAGAQPASAEGPVSLTPSTPAPAPVMPSGVMTVSMQGNALPGTGGSAAPLANPSVSTVALAAPAPAAASTAPPAAAAAAVAAPVPANGIVVFRAKGPSWVEVTDAKGVVKLRKLLDGGESGAATGVLPLQVTVGRVDVTEVEVRGKAFDLRPVSRDNVARFEVK